MMDCKKALVETGGGMDGAMGHLSKSGLAKAGKQSDRTAAEGLVVIASNSERAVLVEVNCETDFVAKDDNFSGFANEAAQLALTAGNIDELNQAAMKDGSSVADATTQLIARLGENIQVRRIDRKSVA